MFAVSFLTVCLAAISVVVAVQPTLKPLNLIEEFGSSEEFEPRVVNGHVANINQFPWQVTVFIEHPHNESTFCSGALLSKNTVLTHADCMVDERRTYVYLGSNVFKSGQRFEVARIIVHPRNNTRSNHHHHFHSIAVLVLDAPVTISASVRPIALPPSKYEFYAFENLLARFAGFGSDGYSTPHKKLHYVNVRVQTIENCTAVFPLPINWKHMILCTVGVDAHVHPGHGDLGSPLVLTYKRLDFIIGIFARVANDTDMTKGPAGFINIAAHARWLGKVIFEHQHDQSPVPPTPPHP